MGGFPVGREQEGQIGSRVPCIDCEPGEDVTFDFSGAQAAAAAVALAGLDPYNTTDGVITRGSVPEPSAMFMSLAYYAGGLPMVRQWQPQIFLQTGTRMLTGGGIWVNHANGGRAGIVAPTSSGPVSLSQVFGGGDAGQDLLAVIAGIWDPITASLLSRGTHDWRANHSRSEALWVSKDIFFTAGNAFTTGGLNSNLAQYLMPGQNCKVFPGDYVYYETSSGLSHGLMVVGYGPPIDWADYLFADAAAVRLEPSEGTSTYSIQPPGAEWLPEAPTQYSDRRSNMVRNYTRRFASNNVQNLLVPYVCDWWGAPARHQGPRPFYATRYIRVDASGNQVNDSQAQNPQASNDYWLFVPAPDSVTVTCEYVLAFNCEEAIKLYIDPAGTGTRGIIQIRADSMLQ